MKAIISLKAKRQWQRTMEQELRNPLRQRRIALTTRRIPGHCGPVAWPEGTLVAWYSTGGRW